MTKISRSSGPLEEEEAPLVAPAGDLEDGSGANGSDETVAGSGGGSNARPRGEDPVLVAVTTVMYFMTCLATCYLLISTFYLPGADDLQRQLRVMAIIGGVLLAVAGFFLGVDHAICCCCRSPRGPE